MPDDDPTSSSVGGMAALQVAQAHLTTLLTASDTLDNKASLLVAVNVALFGVFFGALISATEVTPWIALAAPSVLFVLALIYGGVTLRPRGISQFIAPVELLASRSEGFRDDELAWSYVRSIEEASEGASQVLNEKALGLLVLALLTVAQLVASAASAAIWIP